MEQIPLPHQTPKIVDLSMYPIEVQESHAIDTLVRQNQDLIARLAVSLQRASELEQRTKEYHQHVLHQQTQIDHIQDEKLTREKIEIENNKELLYFRTKSSGQEKQFAEYYTVSQEQIENLKKELDFKSQVLASLNKYRKKMKTLVKTFKSRYEQRLHLREQQLMNLQTQLSEAHTELKQVQNALLRTQHQVQHVSAQFEQDKANWTQLHQEQCEKLAAAAIASQQLERLSEQNANYSNELISLKRTESDLQERNQQMGAEIMQLRLEKSDMESARNELSLSKSQNQVLQDHSARLLLQIEKLEMKDKSLQRLNQELSLQLQHLRKENESIRLSPQDAEPVGMNTSPDNFKRIHDMISEIEFGFASSSSFKEKD